MKGKLEVGKEKERGEGQIMVLKAEEKEKTIP